jgi:hypothetical protein
MTAELIRGFDRAEAAYDAMMPPEPPEPAEPEIDFDALRAAGYSIDWVDMASGWSWSLHGQVWSDGYYSDGEAWEAAHQHWLEHQPDLCDQCGDQGACPECRS